MNTADLHSHTRRGFLHVIGGACAAAACRMAWGEPADQVKVRATSGDAIEPKWDQRLTISVGPAKANLVGTDQRVLQAAVDYAAALGGGTVHILPGTYRLRNAIYLRSKVRITGSGEDAILLKEPSVTAKLAADSDWFDQENSRQSGISIGHRDTDNLIRQNTIRRSGQVGILFRPERDQGFVPHHNRLEANRIEDSGPENGVAIDVQRCTEGVTLARNEILETRGPAQRTGIRIAADTQGICLDGNRIDGVAVPVADLRKRTL